MIKPKRQLIFFWTYLQWGGAQIYLIAIMKEAKPDWDIVVILPRNSLPDILGYLDAIDVKYKFIDACLDNDPAPTLKRKLQRQWRRIHAEVEAFRYLRGYNLSECILHIEVAPWQSWQFLTALLLRGANIFITLHNAPPRSRWWRRILWKSRMQFVSRMPGFHVFTSNKDTKNKIMSLVEANFWKNIEVTYTCINPPEIEAALGEAVDPNAIRRKHSIDENKFVVLCVGQFVDRKGRWVFLKAAKSVLKENSDIQFVWLTPKSPTDDEIKRIDEYGLGDGFRLILSETVGKDRHGVLSFFRIADAFALPSYVEGLPIALLEAMALGLPSISTNVYAIPEAVRDGETGVLIEAGDSEGLAREILNLKDNCELRTELARNGRHYVIEHFDERVASRIAIAKYKECFDIAD